MTLLLEIGFVLTAFLGVLLIGLGAIRSSVRRAVTGVVLLALLGPGWLITRGGRLPRGRSYIFVQSKGMEADVQRLVAQVRHASPHALVGVVELAPTPPSGAAAFGPLASPNWENAAAWRQPAETVLPQVPIAPGWLARVAGAAQLNPLRELIHLLPRPTIVVPLAADRGILGTNEAAKSVDPERDIHALRAADAHLLVVDTGGNAGRGRLELSFANPEVRAGQRLNFLPATTEARLELLDCPFAPFDPSAPEGTSGKYQLEAWLDGEAVVHPGDPPALATLSWPDVAEIITPAPSPSLEERKMFRETDPKAPRRTVFKLSSLQPPSAHGAAAPVSPALLAGYHRLDVRLIFNSFLGGKVSYSASGYFNVVNRRLVLIEQGTSTLLTRHSWVHHFAADTAVPPGPGRLIERIFANPGRSVGRLPFSQLDVFYFKEFPGKLDELKILLAKDVSMVVLVEPPRWSDLIGLASVLDEFARKGGLVVTAAPPAPPADVVPATAAPSWLPAYGEPLHPAETDPSKVEARDESAGSRIYFLVDNSRPASKFRASNGSTDDLGALLQRDVINALYHDLDVKARNGTPITDPLVLPAGGPGEDLQVSAAGAHVGQFQAGDPRKPVTALIIPPLLDRIDTRIAAVNRHYATPGLGVAMDVCSSWVGARLWTLDLSERLPRYNDVLKDLVHPPDPSWPAGPSPRNLEPLLDAPLLLPQPHPGSTVVIFALDIAQPTGGLALPAGMTPLPDKVWFDGPPATELAARPPFYDPKGFSKLGIDLVVVPIRIHPLMQRTYNKAAPGGLSLKNAVTGWGHLLTDASTPPVPLGLELGGTDGAAAASKAAVITALLKHIKERAGQAHGELRIHDPGRAIDLRTITSVDPPWQWRRLKLTHENGPAPAATLRDDTDPTSISPAVVWCPVGSGAAFTLAYWPLAYDMWRRDWSLYLDDALSNEDGAAEADGWGFGRLYDPIALRGRLPARGLTIEEIRPAADQSHVLVDCILADLADGAIFVPPHLYIETAGGPPAGGTETEVKDTVVVSNLDIPLRRLTLAISAPASQTLHGVYALGLEGSTDRQAIFLDIRPPKTQLRALRAALEQAAQFSGGGSMTEDVFWQALPDSFAATAAGSVILIALAALLLSPAVRRWSLAELWRRLRPPPPLQHNAEGESADLEAAFNASGMDFGSPHAQRPIGRILQMRAIRPGDSPLAARKVDWAYFVDEIAKSLGSSPMPRVLETPRAEALSVLTVLDLPPGTDANDTGRHEDRLRTMAQIAALNALVARKRSGLHHLAALQAPEDRESVEPAPPEETEAAVTRLARAAARSETRVPPGLVSGEAVILLVNPASAVDDALTVLARRCVEERCPLAVILLLHPEQAREVGLLRVPTAAGASALSFAVVDRNDIAPPEIQHFLQQRIETLTNQATVADGYVCTLRTDQSVAEMVTVLSEEIWTQL